MTGFSSSATVTNGLLRIRLRDSPVVRTVEIDCVLDYTDFGEIIGIEVLDLKRQLDGGSVEPINDAHPLRTSYDGEIDALYLHVSQGRGQRQQRALARCDLDAENRVIGLEVSVPIPEA